MKTAKIMAIVFFISGCASVPPAVVTYHNPEAQLSVKITQSVMCVDRDDDANVRDWRIITASSAEMSPLYVASETSTGTIAFSELSDNFADATATITLTPDGRLKSVNAESTGRGREIVSSALDVVGSVFGFGMPGAVESTEGVNVPHPCEDWSRLNEGKPVVATSTTVIKELDDRMEVEIANLGEQHPEIHSLFPDITISISKKRALPKRIDCPTCSSDIPMLKVPSHAIFDAIALVHQRDVNGNSNGTAKSIGHTSFLVPLLCGSDKLNIPIYDPAAFGKVEVAVVFGEAGQITSIKYGTSDSTSSLGGSLTDIASLFEDDELAKLKAENDLIYQQQRKLKCEADRSPENCE